MTLWPHRSRWKFECGNIRPVHHVCSGSGAQVLPFGATSVEPLIATEEANITRHSGMLALRQ